MIFSRVNSFLVLAVLLVFSGRVALVGGAAIQSGKAYYITIAKHPQCGDKAQFLGFNNNACSTHNTVTLGPKPTNTAWARWVLDVKEAVAGGSYVVQIFDHWDPTEPPAPKCQGKLSVTKPKLCKTGQGLTKVELQSASSQKWILRPVGSKTYQILSATRRNGCFRFLGAAGKCGALKPALFKADDGSGLHRWSINEIPDQQASQPAGEPAITSSTTTASAWVVEWTDGAAGSPEETYALKCANAGSTSCFDVAVGPIMDNIPRGAGAGTLEGLPADTHLHCFVVALNQDGATCSAPQAIRTAPVRPDAVGPGAPTVTDSAIVSGVWKVKWTDGSAGDPEEVYSALCVDFGDTCGAVATGNSVYGLKRGVQTADVTGLPTGKYSCYVRAENVVDTACSEPQTVEVPPNPNNTPPGKPTALIDIVYVDTWLVTWNDGSKGVPEETYSAYCAHRGAGCSDRHQGFPETGIARGVERGRVVGLPYHTPLDCFVIAENLEGRVCSDPVAVEIGRHMPPVPPPNVDRAAGQPWGVQTLAVTTTTWTVLWYDGDAGYPQETYTVLCTLPRAGCHGPAIGITSYIARGVGYGTVQGLAPGTSYECYVIATNRAGSVCSAGLAITTSGSGPPLAAPGKPQALHTVNTGPTFWSARWIDGAIGVPLERYELVCYPHGTPCDTRTHRRRLLQITVPGPLPPVAGTYNIPRGAQGATVVNLPSGRAYSCYVKAINAVGGVCSDGVTVLTPIGTPQKAGQPTQLRTTAVSQDTWSAAWFDGAIGTPKETYNLACVRPGAGCEADPAAATDGISRGTGAGSVVGLAAGTNYDCFVIATNSAGFVCSAPVAITTSSITPPATKPGMPTIVTSTTTGNNWHVSWTYATPETPNEAYIAACLTLGSACDDFGNIVERTAAYPKSWGNSLNLWLPAGKFTCYVVAVNYFGFTCSQPTNVQVASTLPGKPTSLTFIRDVTGVRLEWTVGIAGDPEEQYAVKCVKSPGLCGAPAVGTIAAGIPRTEPTGHGTTTGISQDITLNCFAIAYTTNVGTGVCSDALYVPGIPLP